MILRVVTNDGQEIITSVDKIQTKGLAGSSRTVIQPINTMGGNEGDIDLNQCRVELLPNG